VLEQALQSAQLARAQIEVVDPSPVSGAVFGSVVATT
jgi:hypothetical protein